MKWALAYLFRRMAHGLLLLLGVSLVSFTLLDLAPGDFYSRLSLDPHVSPEAIAALRSSHGLTKTLPARYLHWVGGALRGDLGYSLAYEIPVAPLLWARTRNTLLLTVTSGTLAWLLGIPLGALAAASGGRGKVVFGSVTAGLLATPELVLSLLVLLLVVRTGLLPAGGMTSSGHDLMSLPERIRDVLAHMAVPVLILTAGSLPVILRHAEAGIGEALDAPFIVAVRACGLSPARILFRYALPMAANPLLSLGGLTVAALLSESLLLENIVSWPGLGPLLVEAVLSKDLYVVVGGVMLTSLFLIAGNLAADLLQYFFDPRLRQEER